MRNVLWTACFLLGVGAGQFLPVAPAPCEDWPQWRGSNRDGIASNMDLPKKWPAALRAEWKASVGEGYASPVVVGDRVYVFTRQKDDELVWCFDLASGKELW